MATVARADDPVPTRTVALAEKATHLVVTVVLPEIYDDNLAEKLVTTSEDKVALRVLVFEEGEQQALWLTNASAAASYDFVADDYDVRLRGPLGQKDLKEKTRASVVADLTQVRELPVCPVSILVPGHTYYLGVIADLNPVPAAVAAEIRKRLTRPRGQVGTDSLFGTFVSIFANSKAPEADRVLRFRSQRFNVELR